MRIGCADCDCIVDNGERVIVCASTSRCCCLDIPIAKKAKTARPV